MKNIIIASDEDPKDKKDQDRQNFLADVAVSILGTLDAKPIVSLSGEKNFKAVTNWMRKHMETYPETKGGFFVRFIDQEGKEGYKVDLCGKNEKGEKINGISYKITPYTFDDNDDMKEREKIQ